MKLSELLTLPHIIVTRDADELFLDSVFNSVVSLCTLYTSSTDWFEYKDQEVDLSTLPLIHVATDSGSDELCVSVNIVRGLNADYLTCLHLGLSPIEAFKSSYQE
jgi:hypothetical protein